MSMDIAGMTGHSAVLRESVLPRKAAADPNLAAARAAAKAASDAASRRREAAADAVFQELEQVSWVFNHRLKLSVNNELDRVIVKIIDRDTDKVIKELPPAELQRVYSRIREAIGLLVDTEI